MYLINGGNFQTSENVQMMGAMSRKRVINLKISQIKHDQLDYKIIDNYFFF